MGIVKVGSSTIFCTITTTSHNALAFVSFSMTGIIHVKGAEAAKEIGIWGFSEEREKKETIMASVTAFCCFDISIAVYFFHWQPRR